MTDSKELTITMRKLREWRACDDGRQWFESKFPQGAVYSTVQQALRADNRFADSRWLADAVFQSLLVDPAGVTNAATEDAKAEIAYLAEQTKPEAIQAETKVDVGVDNQAEDSARIGSSGYSAQIGSSGDYARIGSSGDSARIGSSGDSAQIGSSGDYAQIGSSGNYARINATGRNAAVACVGQGSRARAGEGGFIALAWYDEKADRPRITVGYVGETIKADTWYRVDNSGEFVEAGEIK